MAEKKVNIDYICVIRQNGDKTTFDTIDIPASSELVSKLEAMVENNNVSVLDMQAQMDNAFAYSSRGKLNYVAPYSYHDSYITMALYPAGLTFAEYNAEAGDYRKQITEAFAEKNKVLRANDPGKYEISLANEIREKMASFTKDLKENYLSKAMRYIWASNYIKTMSRARSMSDVRMYSTDTLGWSNFEYKVTDDITIGLGTNFGYGMSSYFRLCLRYKGIDILPYSHMVKYYYADMRDLIRYLRLYSVTRDSWNTAFSFVEKVANLASSAPREFLQTWVLNEVKEMVKGLHGILDNPAFHVKDMLSKNAGLLANREYITVRNMSWSERSTYGVYPEEMTMAIQAEKITGALDFLGNLSALSQVIPDISGFIAEIRDMAVAVIPKLDAMVSSIEAKVAIAKEKLVGKEIRLESVLGALEPHVAEIDRLYDTRSEEDKDKSRVHFESTYSSTHKDYVTLKAHRDELSEQIAKLETDIRMRESFRGELLGCRKRVSDAGLVEAKKAA